jgi:sulfite exporter TauE/SafE
VVSVLGKSMNMVGDSAVEQVLAYTIFHYVAFLIVGIVLTVVVHQAERTPGILAGLLVAIVIMTLGFYMIAAAFAQSALGDISWIQIFVANLLASALMLGYLWRKHPRLERQLKQALEGTDDS